MKKALYSLALLAMTAGTVVYTSSCNKIKDEIASHLKAFSFTAATVEYTVPVVTNTQTYTETQSVSININQIIKDESGVNFDIDDISKITIKKVTLKVIDGDAANNWTNFEYAKLKFNSSKGKANNKPDLESTVTIADVESERFSDKVFTFGDVNVMDYVNGDETTLEYTIEAKARRATTKGTKIEATVEYSFVP